MDIARLADPIQPSNPLLQHFRISWQAEENQVPRELEVPPLAADFRADENSRALRLGEIRRVSITLEH